MITHTIYRYNQIVREHGGWDILEALESTP